MTGNIKAVYRHGVFIPETACDLPEESQVELFVQGPVISPPAVTDMDRRRQLLAQIAERIRQYPFPLGAPRFGREELHERR